MDVRLDASELDKFAAKLKTAPDVIAEAKRKAFAEAAPMMKRAVDTAIGGSGKVQSWQQDRVGSKGGYAAVSPKPKTYTEVNGKGKRYAVGQVTNAIDSGHRFRPPSGRDRYYRPRILSGRQRVEGRHFYKRAQAQIPQIAERALGTLEDALQAHFKD